MSALGGRAAASGVGPSKMSSAEMNVRTCVVYVIILCSTVPWKFLEIIMSSTSSFFLNLLVVRLQKVAPVAGTSFPLLIERSVFNSDFLAAAAAFYFSFVCLDFNSFRVLLTSSQPLGSCCGYSAFYARRNSSAIFCSLVINCCLTYVVCRCRSWSERIRNSGTGRESSSQFWSSSSSSPSSSSLCSSCRQVSTPDTSIPHFRFILNPFKHVIK